MPPSETLIAVDIGNSRTKLGRFCVGTAQDELPRPDSTLRLATDWSDPRPIEKWLRGVDDGAKWFISSVHRPSCERLRAHLAQYRSADAITLLSAADLPLEVQVDQPEKVGLDRLATAVAANCLRPANTPAVVVDLGSAITVDLISARGEFRGGAILPGIAMAARAMHQQTDLLPATEMDTLDEPPPALGRDTIAAMRSGLYWGAVGAMRELIARLTDECDQTPEVYLTGGAAPAVADRLGSLAVYIPDMALRGTAVAILRG